jgi:hypothetical protein
LPVLRDGNALGVVKQVVGVQGEMGDSAIDYADLTRICEFTRALHRPHHLGGDEVIEREFNAVPGGMGLQP